MYIYTYRQRTFLLSDKLLIEVGGIKRGYVFKISPGAYFVTAASLKL
jgi:hypothetical protein